MPDGTRKRRFSTDTSKCGWYAQHRAMRFARRFGGWQLVVAEKNPKRQTEAALRRKADSAV